MICQALASMSVNVSPIHRPTRGKCHNHSPGVNVLAERLAHTTEISVPSEAGSSGSILAIRNEAATELPDPDTTA